MAHHQARTRAEGPPYNPRNKPSGRFQHPVQRAPADPQQLRRPQLVAAAALQHILHMPLDHRIQPHRPLLPALAQRRQIAPLHHSAACAQLHANAAKARPDFPASCKPAARPAPTPQTKRPVPPGAALPRPARQNPPAALAAAPPVSPALRPSRRVPAASVPPPASRAGQPRSRTPRVSACPARSAAPPTPPAAPAPGLPAPPGKPSRSLPAGPHPRPSLPPARRETALRPPGSAGAAPAPPSACPHRAHQSVCWPENAGRFAPPATAAAAPLTHPRRRPPGQTSPACLRRLPLQSLAYPIYRHVTRAVEPAPLTQKGRALASHPPPPVLNCS